MIDKDLKMPRSIAINFKELKKNSPTDVFAENSTKFSKHLFFKLPPNNWFF